MNKIILTTLFICLVNSSFSQKYSIKGKVVSESDSTNVVGAVVRCHPDSTVNVAFTDSEGNFKIPKVSIKTNKISIQCLGFKEIVIPVLMKGGDLDLGVVRLPVAVYDVGRVSIKIPMMVQYGDTVQYNAAAFKMMEGATAFDLVSKLPGIFVMDGKIKARGRDVFEVLLDGKKYYGGDAIRALKNIPVAVLDNIQLYDQQSDDERLTGYKDGKEKQVFNVRSKRPLDLKGWTTMSLMEGVNTNGNVTNLYGFNGNGTLDAQKRRLTVDAKVANLMNPTDGFAMMESASLAGASLPIASPRVMNLSKNYDTRLSYGLSNKKIKIDLMGGLNGNREDRLNSSFDSYYPVDGVFNSRERTSKTMSYNKVKGSVFDLRLEWTLHKNHTIRFTSSLNDAERDLRASNIEDILQNGDSISRLRTTELGVGDNSQFLNELNYYFRMGAQRALTLGGTYQKISMNNETTPHNYSNEVYDEMTMRWIPASVDNNYRRKIDNSEYIGRALVAYNQAIGKKHQVKVLFESKISRNDDKQLQYGYNETNGDYSSFFNDRSNDMNIRENNHSGNLFYSFIGHKKLRLNIDFGVTYAEQKVLDYINPQYDVRNDEVLLNSNVRVLYRLSQSDILNFNFVSSGDMPMSQYLSPVINDTNPSNIMIGNPDLKGTDSYRLNLSYNTTNKNSFSAHINANWRTNGVVRLLEFMPTDRDTVIYAGNNGVGTEGKGYTPQRGATVTRMGNRSGNFQFNAGIEYGVRMNPIASTLSFSLGYDYNRMISYDGSDDYTKTHTEKIGLFFTSNLAKSLELKLRYKVDYSIKLIPNADRITLLSQGASGELVYQFLNRMRLSTSCAWTQFKQNNGAVPSNSMVSIDAGLGVYLDRAHNFLLSVNGKNLLDNTSGIADYFYDTYSSRKINDGFGRYAMLQLSYKFNSMQKKQKLKKGEKTNSGNFFDN